MSGGFASIFLSVLIVKSHKIVTSVLSTTSCGVCSCHFSMWGSLKFLRNIQCMKLATRSCLWRYSVLTIIGYAHTIWTTVSSLSLSMHWATDKIYYIFSKKRFSDTPVKWNFPIPKINPKKAGGGGGERGQPEPPCDFSKRVFSRERVKPCFYLGFIIIISHVQKIGRFSTSILTIFTNFSDSLTFNCCKRN